MLAEPGPQEHKATMERKVKKVKKVNRETERKKVIVIIKGYMDASIHSKHLPVINLLLVFTYSVNPPPPLHSIKSRTYYSFVASKNSGGFVD